MSNKTRLIMKLVATCLPSFRLFEHPFLGSFIGALAVTMIEWPTEMGTLLMADRPEVDPIPALRNLLIPLMNHAL